MDNNKKEFYGDRRMVSLRKYVGKQLVSFLRKGDFAHAGEEEAIELVMSYFHKNPDQSILDAGCGLGGTAEYLRKNEWGKVSGFDIESEAIEYARQQYPNITFYTCDAVDCDQYIHDQFDIIALFNTFYAFPNQSSALRTLNKLSKKNGHIAIFDYSDPCIDQITPLFRPGDKNTTSFIPIKLNRIDTLLEAAGWKKTKLLNISDQYLKWYDQLIERLRNRKTDVLRQFNMPAFESAMATYTKIRNSILDDTLGGAIIYAQKV